MNFIPEQNMNTPLTFNERCEIKKWLDRRYSCSKISKILKRGKNTVVHEVRRNGGVDNYNPVEAHNKALNRKVIRDIKCSKTIREKTSNNYPSMEDKISKLMNDRISNLEMQVEILIDEIKRIKQ